MKTAGNKQFKSCLLRGLGKLFKNNCFYANYFLSTIKCCYYWYTIYSRILLFTFICPNVYVKLFSWGAHICSIHSYNSHIHSYSIPLNRGLCLQTLFFRNINMELISRHVFATWMAGKVSNSQHIFLHKDPRDPVNFVVPSWVIDWTTPLDLTCFQSTIVQFLQ